MRLIYILLSITFLSCAHPLLGQPEVEGERQAVRGATPGVIVQPRYMPKELRGIDFNLPLEEFRRLRPASEVRTGEAEDDQVEYTEKFSRGEVAQIAYYFDAEGMQPLRQVVLTYRDRPDVRQMLTLKFGPANAGKEWLVTDGHGTMLRIWTEGASIGMTAE